MVLTKQDLLINTLKIFYDNMDVKVINTILSILNGSNVISLRIIDWFVTNYSKKYNITLNEIENRFVVFLDYKSQLKAYSKKFFDPFCRRERIEFKICDELIITTVGQLNFFKWIIQNNIIEYITKNLSDIELDMHNSLKKAYSKKSETRKKRHELSISANKCMTKQKINIVLKF
jgi:hypothetical protein